LICSIDDRLLSSGRPVPVPEEGPDWVKVTIKRRIMKPEVIQLITQADARYQLAQRERITLAALAQSEGMTARELATLLDVGNTDKLASWFGRLLKIHLVQSTGRTQATRYFVDPELLRDSGIKLPTTLKRIEPHRLRALIQEDLGRYPASSSMEINKRIGAEISTKTVKRALDNLIEDGLVVFSGERRWRRYRLADKGQLSG